MASIVVKPKERQFQVVPVPAVFTRGRWECIDYKDNGIGSGGPPRDFSESQTIEFDKSSSSTTQSTVATLAPTVAQQQTNVVHTVGGVQAVQPSVANATPIPSVGISHLTSKPETSLPPSSISISAIPSQVSGTILNKQQESIASTQVTFSSGANQNSQQSTPIAETAPPIGLQTPIPPHQSSVVGAQSSAYQQQHGGIPANSSVPHFEISPTHSVPATLGSEFVPPPGVSSVESNISTSNALGAAANGGTSLPCGIAPPTVAIDNKIEQAMDLVKTHLTFAVREEVEILRSTIADLETRVTYLEGENALLRQFAPADVMANLATLVQQQVVALQAQRAANTSAQQQTKMSMQSVPSAPVIMDQSVAPQGSGNGGSAEEQQN